MEYKKIVLGLLLASGLVNGVCASEKDRETVFNTETLNNDNNDNNDRKSDNVTDASSSEDDKHENDTDDNPEKINNRADITSAAVVDYSLSLNHRALGNTALAFVQRQNPRVLAMAAIMNLVLRRGASLRTVVQLLLSTRSVAHAALDFALCIALAKGFVQYGEPFLVRHQASLRGLQEGLSRMFGPLAQPLNTQLMPWLQRQGSTVLALVQSSYRSACNNTVASACLVTAYAELIYAVLYLLKGARG